MAIDPIQMMSFGNFGQQGQGVTGASGAASPEFADVFKNAWNTTTETQKDMAEKQYLQSIGEINDTHTLPIAQGKAELALSLLVNLRTKALDSYNELMRISI